MKLPSHQKVLLFLKNPIFILILVFGIYFLTGTGIDYKTKQVQDNISWTKGNNLKQKDVKIIKSKLNKEKSTIAIITPAEMQAMAKKLNNAGARTPTALKEQQNLGGLELTEEQVTAILKQMDEEALEIDIPPEEILALAEGLGKNWKQVLQYEESAGYGENAQVNLPDELKNHQEDLKDYNTNIDEMLISE